MTRSNQRKRKPSTHSGQHSLPYRYRQFDAADEALGEHFKAAYLAALMNGEDGVNETIQQALETFQTAAEAVFELSGTPEEKIRELQDLANGLKDALKRNLDQRRVQTAEIWPRVEFGIEGATRDFSRADLDGRGE